MSRAFTAHAPLVSALPGKEGKLGGLKVSIKDIFDVKGFPTGCGCPPWLAEHPEPVEQDARAVQLLRENGATFVGKTKMDEMAFSLTGENDHYGTPPNPRAEGCLPGGSSSGSAVSVAEGSCDISLGTDTGGSVRLPSSHCGLWGLRPTHGRISLEGARALSRSFDTAGVFARNSENLRLAASALLEGKSMDAPPAPRWLVAPDYFDVMGKEERGIVEEFIKGLGVDVTEVSTGDVKEHADVFMTIQPSEVWEEYGAWIRAKRPAFGGVTADRFKSSEHCDPEKVACAKQRREEIKEEVKAVLKNDGLLLIPAAPCFPPKLGEGDQPWRIRVLHLTALAGLVGLPQVVFPLRAEGPPLGMGVVGPPGSDEWLLESVQKLVNKL